MPDVLAGYALCFSCPIPIGVFTGHLKSGYCFVTLQKNSSLYYFVDTYENIQLKVFSFIWLSSYVQYIYLYGTCGILPTSPHLWIKSCY